MDGEPSFLISGIIFGLSAGISPGPLLILVISETLQYNMKEGIKVACAPLITDMPIVLATTIIFSRLSHFESIVGLISLCGALFIGYLGYESITAKGIEITTQVEESQSLKRGIITNFLNPHPYLFWCAVGAPTVIKALAFNLLSVLLFIVGFYVCIVGSKIIVAAMVERSHFFMKSTIYIYMVRFLGLLLLIFSVLFLIDGLTFLGVL
ncbi:MAG: hypothetical protein AMJ42_00245 [Deltaproteobacteria bacterium DG_8]|nr:MAG: hypothetical protein AMJ42_00245 [Deltaproteobacteria bacterium DG_8]